MTALVVAETIVLGLVLLLVAGLLRSHAELLRRLDELGRGTGAAAGVGGRNGRGDLVPPAPDRPAGAPAVDVAGETLDGAAVKVAVGAGGRDTLLAFLSSSCLTCQGFWDSLQPERRGEVPGDPRVVVVTKDRTHESPTRLRRLAPEDLPLVMSTAAWEAYSVPVSPYFVYVDGARRAVEGEGVAEQWDQIVSLLRDAREDRVVADRTARQGEPTSGGGGRRRILRADLELEASEIGPDHPSLYAPDDPTARRSEAP